MGILANVIGSVGQCLQAIASELARNSRSDLEERVRIVEARQHAHHHHHAQGCELEIGRVFPAVGQYEPPGHLRVSVDISTADIDKLALTLIKVQEAMKEKPPTQTPNPAAS
jgi:hypothetical protein